MPRIREPRGSSKSGSAHHSYDFIAPSLDAISGDSLASQLIKTAAFRRLEGVRFLGGIDYLLIRVPNGSDGNVRYTRYQHSIGVAGLALIYSEEKSLSPKDHKLILAAALLHDIGHCALSHTLEPVFQEKFGINHHIATEQIVLGRVAFGQEIASILVDHDVDPGAVVHLMSGADESFDGFFSGPINFDTIEGILRSWAYVQYERRFPSPDMVVRAAIHRKDAKDEREIDDFWKYKDRVYRYLVRSPQGVIADYLCQEAFKRDLDVVGPDDYLTTEKSLFAKCRNLSELIGSGVHWTALPRELDKPIAYQARRFFIDSHGDFFAHQDKLRYQQNKVSMHITAEKADHWDGKPGDLFNVHSF